MQQLTDATNAAALERCAGAVLEAALAVSRYVRAEMWRRRPGGMTVPQFRALAHVNADPECAPSQLAESLMLSRPAITRLLDELVRKGLLVRRPDADDRRRQLLSLTAEGRARLESYYGQARTLLAERLAALAAAERELLTEAMERLGPVFGGAGRDPAGRVEDAG
jgi:DNA-binding MarR family transcriptional regulator